MRRTKNKQHTLDSINQEITAHLEETARLHGQDSGAYEALEGIYEVLLRDLCDEVEP